MKRPALRGVVTRAGVTGDARPLSCFFFRLSALPLPWAFYRTQMLQNLDWQRAERVPGGWVFCPVSRQFLLRRWNFWGHTTFRNSGPQRPNTAFQFYGGVWMLPSPQAGHKPSHSGQHGALHFQSVADIGIGRKTYWGGSLAHFQFPRTF